MFHLKIHMSMVVAAYKTFGLRIAAGASVKLAVDAIMHGFLALDRVVYPAYKKVKVEKPLFIVGHPRSGTTFFHRLLTQTNDYCTFRLLDIAFPSLLARRLLGNLVDPMKVIRNGLRDPRAVFPDGSHDTDNESVEEEELLFMWRNDTQMNIFLTPLAFSDDDWSSIVFNDAQERSRRMASAKFLRGCFQRQIFYTGRNRIVAKMPYSTLRLKTLMEEFPDGRFVYLVRSPLKTLPSHLSLHRTFFANRWGLENISKQKLMTYYQRRYQHNVDLYRYFDKLLHEGNIDLNRIKVIVYDRFIDDLERAFDDLVRFADLPVSEALREKIKAQAAKQRTYQRPHQIQSLEHFGLTREQIVKDLGFVFDAYGFDREE